VAMVGRGNAGGGNEEKKQEVEWHCIKCAAVDGRW